MGRGVAGLPPGRPGPRRAASRAWSSPCSSRLRLGLGQVELLQDLPDEPLALAGPRQVEGVDGQDVAAGLMPRRELVPPLGDRGERERDRAGEDRRPRRTECHWPACRGDRAVGRLLERSDPSDRLADRLAEVSHQLNYPALPASAMLLASSLRRSISSFPAAARPSGRRIRPAIILAAGSPSPAQPAMVAAPTIAAGRHPAGLERPTPAARCRSVPITLRRSQIGHKPGREQVGTARRAAGP